MTSTQTPRVALVSCERLLPDGDPDEQLLAAACRTIGLDVSVVAWTDRTADWDSFDVTVLRSSWDYTADREAFLNWVQATPRLHNPASVVAANSDKTYLADLIAAGIPVVPTVFAAPGEPVELPAAGEFVVKPSVGAGSRGAGRFAATAHSEAAEHAAALHEVGRTVMVQPYLGAVDSAGETAMIFIDGQFSHSIRKGPMLPPSTRHPVNGHALYVQEQISTRQASAVEHALAERVMEYYAGALSQPPLYARVDLLPSPDGPVVIEVELIEPSLFLAHSPGAAAKLATAIAGRTH